MRVYSLRDKFEQEGPTAELEAAYNKLDAEIQEVLLAVAKKVVRKNMDMHALQSWASME